MLIGHSLENDLHALRLNHTDAGDPLVVDTAMLFQNVDTGQKHGEFRHVLGCQAKNTLHYFKGFKSKRPL